MVDIPNEEQQKKILEKEKIKKIYRKIIASLCNGDLNFELRFTVTIEEVENIYNNYLNNEVIL